MTVDHKGMGLGTAANVSTITGILTVSRTVFSDEIKKILKPHRSHAIA